MKPIKFEKLVRRTNKKHLLLAAQCRGWHKYYKLLAIARSIPIPSNITAEQFAGTQACRGLAVAWGMAKFVQNSHGVYELSWS